MAFNGFHVLLSTVSRRIEYKESANIEGILNQTLIVPNLAALSGCSYTADNFFLRHSFNALLILYGASPVVNTTIYVIEWIPSKNFIRWISNIN